MLKHFHFCLKYLLLLTVLILFDQSSVICQIESQLNSRDSYPAAFKVNDDTSKYNGQLDAPVENRFRISANTIIRTGESRVLGAKYINETVQPANRDCLTWCLETPNCNVAVYEEKDTHSCYMFDCGSPKSFLCQFTTHTYFVSSILKMTQHSYELSQWGKQEQELNMLKATEAAPTTIPASSLSTSVTPIVTTTSFETTTANPCHHYQFKCANSTECIAIYNVCDGIPQCPDGSDESIDLKCHMKDSRKEIVSNVPFQPRPALPQPVTTTNSARPTPTPTIVRNQQNTQMSQSMKTQHLPLEKVITHRVDNMKSSWPIKPHFNQNQAVKQEYQSSDNVDGLGNPFVHKHSQFVAAYDPHVQSLNRWSNDYDQYSVQHSGPLEQQQYSPYDSERNYQRAEEQYIPADYEGVKGYVSYPADDVPYWSNQEALQDEDFPLPGMKTASNKQSNYPDKENYYAQQLARASELYPEHHIMHNTVKELPAIPRNTLAEIEEYKAHRFPQERPPSYQAYEEMQKHYLPMKPKVYVPRPSLDGYSNEDVIRANLVNQNQMPVGINIERHHPFDYEMKHLEKPVMPPMRKVPEHAETNVHQLSKPLPTSSATTRRPTEVPKPVQKRIVDFKMSVTELYQSRRIRTQETNSAILALVVGLTITFVLMVFLGIRVKTIRRRLSRKGRGLAHDSDYLVNGMYL